MTNVTKGLSLLLPLLPAALLGCTDPNGKLDEFANAFPDGGTTELPSPPPPGPGPQAEVTTGTFFATLVPAGLGIHIYFLADVELTLSEEESSITLALTPLSAEGKEVAGDPIAPATIELVGDTAAFKADFGSITIPGAANPISGSDIEATIVLDGSLLSDDYVCGTAGGEVTAPLALALDGTTWAGVRVEAGTSGGALPEPIPDCEAALALVEAP